jgi:hypothetical protein
MLISKLKGRHIGTSGGQTVLTAEEEKSFVSHIVAMANFGFLMTSFDVRLVIKSYLDRTATQCNDLRETFLEMSGLYPS